MTKIILKVEGMDKLQRNLKKLGKVPQKHVTAASKKAMKIVLKSAKINAPVDTGALKKGIIMAGEKSRDKGKKIYRLVFDRQYNDIFQKPNKQGKITGYYPVSQEYGFFAKNGRYIPGFSFVRDALSGNAGAVERKIVDDMNTKIEAELRKAGLR